MHIYILFWGEMEKNKRSKKHTLHPRVRLLARVSSPFEVVFLLLAAITTVVQAPKCVSPGGASLTKTKTSRRKCGHAGLAMFIVSLGGGCLEGCSWMFNLLD